jgi:misacylated tRNA(Ala) deacylase
MANCVKITAPGLSGDRRRQRFSRRPQRPAAFEEFFVMPEQNEKQFDPRMHSAEHIANQTMVRMFDCSRCFSAHIEKKKSKLDYRFERGLEEAEIRELEDRVNEVIRADMPVTEEFMPRAEAGKRFNLGRLPEEAGETLRIVKIGDYDACPCIGPHVKSTAEIGRFRVVSASFDDGVLRIRYKLAKPEVSAAGPSE